MRWAPNNDLRRQLITARFIKHKYTNIQLFTYFYINKYIKQGSLRFFYHICIFTDVNNQVGY